VSSAALTPEIQDAVEVVRADAARLHGERYQNVYGQNSDARR
jgi:hypothetical protein